MTRVLWGLALCSVVLAQAPSQVGAQTKHTFAPVKGQCAFSVTGKPDTVRLSLPKGAGVAFRGLRDSQVMERAAVDANGLVHIPVEKMSESPTGFSVVGTAKFRQADGTLVEIEALIPASVSRLCFKPQVPRGVWVAIAVAAAGGVAACALSFCRKEPGTQPPASISFTFNQASVGRP